MISKRLPFAFFLIVLLAVGTANAQPIKPTVYFNVVGLGSSEGDSSLWYPYPMAVLELLDSSKHQLRVRFPNLGVLGNLEDTLWQPTHRFDSLTIGFRSREQLFHFTAPVSPYVMFVDVIERLSGKILEIRPLPYKMNVEKFATSRYDMVHDPRVVAGDPYDRRFFRPGLLPLTLDVNPTWRAREQFDSSGTYSLSFFESGNAYDVKLSLSMRAASILDIDSASWESFKQQARVAFNQIPDPTNATGEFPIDDPATRSVVRAAYEIFAKRSDGGTDYIVAYRLQKSILLMLAPLSQPIPSPEYEFYRSIARSLKAR